jgi:hypothetical protein
VLFLGVFKKGKGLSTLMFLKYTAYQFLCRQRQTQQDLIIETSVASGQMDRSRQRQTIITKPRPQKNLLQLFQTLSAIIIASGIKKKIHGQLVCYTS